MLVEERIQGKKFGPKKEGAAPLRVASFCESVTQNGARMSEGKRKIHKEIPEKNWGRGKCGREFLSGKRKLR
jgi:hypothetical protein